MNRKRYLYILAIAIAQPCLGQARYTWAPSIFGNSYSTLLNWSPVPLGAPGSNDTVVFNSNVANCNFVSAQHVASFSITSAYTGIITAAGNSTIDGHYSQAGGTFNSSPSLDIKGNFTKTGGIFNHTTGRVGFHVPDGGTNTISGSVTFNTLTVNSEGATATSQRNLNFGSGATTATLILQGGAAPFGYQGTINVTKALSINGTDAGSPTGNSGTFNFNGISAGIASNSGAGENKLGNLNINTSGTYSLSGNISLRGNWTSTQLGSFTAGTSTVNFYGSSGAIVSGTTSSTQAYVDNLKIASGAVLALSGSSQVNIDKDLSDNGTFNTNTGLVRLSGSSSQAISGSNALTTLNALEITNSGTKTLSHTINILDSVKVNAGTLASGGNLVLKSTSAFKGRIAQITGGGAVSGNVTAETFAAGGTTDWSQLGPSGISGLTVANWEGQIPMTCSLCPYGPMAAGAYFVSIQGWNELAASGSTLAYVEQTYTSSLIPGKGYWVYLGNGLSSTTDMTWQVSGSLVSGNQSLTLTNSGATNGDGYNLVSNPYASPISWAKLRNGDNSVDNAIYIYNADLGITTSYVNGSSSPGGAGSANDIIPAGQGFYVRSNAATSTLVAQESNKVPSNTSSNQLLKTSGSQQNSFRLKLKSFDGVWDATVFRFEATASSNFDPDWDAYKIFSSPGYAGYPGVWKKRTSISSRLKNIDYSINSLPLPDYMDVSVPVLVKVYNTGSYTISAVDLGNLPENLCILLEDKLLGCVKDLRSGNYLFSMADTTDTPRFALTFCALNASLGEKEYIQNKDGINIRRDHNAVLIDFDFPQRTRSTVSVTNILGQKIIDDRIIYATKESLRIDLDACSGLLFVGVSTDNGRIVEKIIK